MKIESKNGKNPVSPKKPKRSVELMEVEKEWLKGFISTFPSVVKAGMKIGVDRAVLDRVLTYGSGSEETVTTIRKYIKADKRKTIEA